VIVIGSHLEREVNMIGGNDFTSVARRGWAFFFNKDNAFSEWEADMILYLEARGIAYNRERIALNVGRKEIIEQIRLALRDATDTQLEDILDIFSLVSPNVGG